jgi:hypothetical protein
VSAHRVKPDRLRYWWSESRKRTAVMSERDGSTRRCPPLTQAEVSTTARRWITRPGGSTLTTKNDLHDQSLHADVAHTALLMQLQYPLGPMQIVAAGETERFFKVFLMIWDSDDLERRRCDPIKPTTHLPRDFLLRIYDLPTQALAMSNWTKNGACFARSLHRRRSIRTLFPQIAEAPLYFYSTNASSAGIRKLADQCNETGQKTRLFAPFCA